MVELLKLFMNMFYVCVLSCDKIFYFKIRYKLQLRSDVKIY